MMPMIPAKKEKREKANAWKSEWGNKRKGGSMNEWMREAENERIKGR